MKSVSLLKLRLHLAGIAIVLSASGSIPANAETLPVGGLAVSPIFSDHMVLQKARAVPVWGKAAPGEKITVSISGVSASTTTSNDGNWKAVLNLKNSGPGPFEMVIRGKNEIHIADVLVGEVWLASGQSNMEFSLKWLPKLPQEMISKSANPLVRQFKVEKATSREPVENYKGQWIIAGPGNTENFSTVAYHFAQALQKEIQAPVGIVNATWGGTPSEAWTRKEAIEQIPGIAERSAAQWKVLEEYPVKQKAYVDALEKWIVAKHREDMPSNTDEFLKSDSPWNNLPLLDNLKKVSPTAGVVWLRRKCVVSAENAGRGILVGMDLSNAYETIYWNGKEISRFTPANYPVQRRNHSIPAAAVHEGENILAIRLYSPGGVPRLVMPPIFLNKREPNDWQVAVEKSFPAFVGEEWRSVPALVESPANPSQLASAIYNGMIAPLLGYTIRGAIWYQGESNTDRATQYATAFPLLIEDWRVQRSIGAFPFYFCQLANYRAKDTLCKESNWAELREAQSKTLKLPNTGQAVLIDVGEAGDIHPANKKDVGERLAKIALAKDYGKAIPFSGPVYKSLDIENGRARLHFDHTAGGLVAKPLPPTYDISTAKGQTAPTVRNSPDSELEGFAICGADQKWVWASAKIDGETVVVWSDKVPAPVAVRYAWANNPTCNLYNNAGLPASPFRTDDFPAITKDAKY
jgi:sialate O-acetylesterase